MSSTVWKVIALLGVVLTLVGASAGYIDIATHFQFEGISDHFDYFMLSFLGVAVIAFVGLIGWARYLNRASQVGIAALAFAAPWIICVLGNPIAGFNVHGPAPLFLVLVIPASILAVVLLLMRKAKSLPAD